MQEVGYDQDWYNKQMPLHDRNGFWKIKFKISHKILKNDTSSLNRMAFKFTLKCGFN